MTQKVLTSNKRLLNETSLKLVTSVHQKNTAKKEKTHNHKEEDI